MTDQADPDSMRSERSQAPAHTQVAPPARGSSNDIVSATRKAAAPKRKHPKPVPPTTLVELYGEANAKPSDLLKFLALRDMFITSEEDQRAALELVAVRDPDLAKTRSLAFEVANGHDGRFVAAFGAFLLGTLGPDVRALRTWPPAEAADALTSWRELLEAKLAELAKKEPPKRTLNVLMIAQSILSSRYRLGMQDVIPALSSGLKTTGGPPRQPPVALGHPSLTAALLRFWLEALALWIETARRDGERAKRAEAAEAALTQQVEGLEARVHELEESNADLSSQLDAIREELRTTKLARQAESAQLRGTMKGFLASDLTAILGAAREGLELDPPRVPHALERLDDAGHAIDRKVAWLKSSD